jgi:hypothetical protein
MIRRVLVRRWYSIAIALLAAAILVAGGFIIAVVLQDAQRAATARGGPSPSSTGTSVASPDFMSWVVIPEDADCGACHLTENGAIGLRPVPAIAHPLEGWTDCTACHSSERLVATAPGHSGIHAGACLTCHQPADLPAPLSRPHRELQNTACLDCHGSKAPLPTDMAHRGQTVCWLCHRLPEEQPPVPAHPVSAGQTDCLTCHVAGKVGALPGDHATRTPSECLLCHAPPAAVTSMGSPQPVRRE